MYCKKCKIHIIGVGFDFLCVGCFFQFEVPSKIQQINELMGFDERRQKVIKENLKSFLDSTQIK